MHGTGGEDVVIKSSASQIENLGKVLNNEVDTALIYKWQTLYFVLV